MDSRGLKYPSVTEGLEYLIDSKWFTDEARDRGSAVHVAISAHLQGLYAIPLAPGHQPYFDSARRWIDIAVDKVILVETRLYDHDMGLCGKPDLICVLRNEQTQTLPDFKTAQAEAIWHKYQVQTYRHLALRDRDIATQRGLTIRLKKDGSGGLKNNQEYGLNFAGDFNIFIGLFNAYKIKHQKKD